jgi:hypothetical protein
VKFRRLLLPLLCLAVCSCTASNKGGEANDTQADLPPDGDGDRDGDADGGDSGGPVENEWSMLATEFGSGVLLSAWSDGEKVVMVGGDMAGGSGTMLVYDGAEIKATCVADGIDRALWWVHGTAPGDWIAVGENGIVVQVEGYVGNPRNEPFTSATLFGVWQGEDRTIAVGGDVSAGTGEIWVSDDNGDNWRALATDLPGVAFKVWEDWVVGDGIAYQIDGDTLIPQPELGRLLTVRGRASDDVWAVGGLTSATVLHFDGTSWSEADTLGLGQPLNGVWTGPDEDVWVTGNFGTTARWTGTTWEQPEWPLTTEHFHAVWRHNDETLFVGGNLFSPGDNYGTIGRYGPGTVSVAIDDINPCL